MGVAVELRRRWGPDETCLVFRVLSGFLTRALGPDSNHLGVTHDLPCGGASVHHKCMSEPSEERWFVMNGAYVTKYAYDVNTHLSLPSPTAIMRLLSPSQSRSVLSEVG